MTRFLAAARQDPARIEAQIAEEFAAHMELLERELAGAGNPPERAAALARARFGNTERLARECRSILLKEHTMLRRVHLAVTIVLAVLLVGSVVFGVAAAARAREQAMMARQMEMVARIEAERARDAERQAREQADAAAQKAGVGSLPVPPATESK